MDLRQTVSVTAHARHRQSFLNRRQRFIDISAARQRVSKGATYTGQRDQGTYGAEFGDAISHLGNAFGEFALVGQCVAAKALADGQ